MKFDLGEKNGHTVSIVISDEPIICKSSTTIEYKYRLDELYIDNKLIPKGKNGYYFLYDFTYRYNDDKKVFCLFFNYELANEVCKIFNVKKQTIAFILPKEIEDYFINILNPKGEKLLKEELEKIENEINEKDRLIINDTVISISYNTTYGYSVRTKVSPKSKLLSKIENKLKQHKSIKKTNYLEKYEVDIDYGDYSINIQYELKYSELKEILEMIDNDIKEYEIAKALKEKKKQEHIYSLKQLAKETGEKQEYNRWSEACNDPKEDCSVDMIYQYIMPDGTFELERQHTW